MKFFKKWSRSTKKSVSNPDFVQDIITIAEISRRYEKFSKETKDHTVRENASYLQKSLSSANRNLCSMYTISQRKGVCHE